MPPVSAQKGQSVTLLDGVTTGTGEGIAIPISSEWLHVTFRGEGIITGGTITLEEASNPEYAGDWSPIQIEESDTFPAIDLDSDTEIIIHIFATFRAIRARISSNITGGGDVTLELVCD